MFLRNERALGASPDGQGGTAVKNGTLGTVTSVQGQGEAARLSVRLDPKDAVTPKSEVTFAVKDYNALAHGYAATIHKAQGVTVERAHVLASAAMDRHSVYVALTRHREGVRLHWARDELGSREGLGRTLSRQRTKDVTLDYAGPEGTARAQTAFAARRGVHPLAPDSEIVIRSPIERARASHAAAAQYLDQAERQMQPPPVPLLPAQRDLTGRDSLGRGTTLQEIARAADQDPKVQREATDRVQWLRAAYRDPQQAETRLAALIKDSQGDRAEAAAKLRERPEQLGALLGREGLFAGRGTQLDRARARSAVNSITGGLQREAVARQKAGTDYVAAVEAQRTRDSIGVPGLSQRAWRAVEAVEQARAASVAQDSQTGPQAYWRSVAATQSPEVAKAWQREVVARPEVVAELQAMAEAAEQRLGAQAVGQGNTAGQGITMSSREGLAGISRAVSAVRDGQQAVQAQERAQMRTQEVKQQRLGIRRGPGIGR
jgi:hypothetical protein